MQQISERLLHDFLKSGHTTACNIYQQKEDFDMTDLSILDLQNLRHLIGGYETTHCKMTDYAAQAQDAQVKKLFQDAADSAMKNKQELMKFV